MTAGRGNAKGRGLQHDDREAQRYAQKRAQQRRQRQRQERRSYDPAPPSDDDWTVAEPDSDGVRRIPAPATLAEALGALVRRRGWDERLRASRALSRWETIVGGELAARCEPVRMMGGMLVIRAESQVWATQLRYLAPQLQANLNAELGHTAVTGVRIEVGPLEGPPPD